MSIAIGMICIFTIVTLRDELLMHQQRRDHDELQSRFLPHEEACCHKALPSYMHKKHPKIQNTSKL